MKKVFLTIAAMLLIGINAFADKVSSAAAQSVAKKFMNASSVTLVWDGNEAAKAGSDPVFYVFNVSGGGWVIVSAEDSTTPILGYSDTGSFRSDNLPVNLAGWMGSIRNDIRKAREDRLSATVEVRRKWDNPVRVATRAGESKKVLTTASWNQLSPYNGYLSQYVKRYGSGVSRLYTGCVATAMAEVLRYHQWPEKGTGTLEGYTTESNSYTVTGYSLGHSYDWDNMPLTYSNSATTEQKNAVAQLMLDCGVMVHMDYGTDGSGAFAEDIVPALVEHMGYSKQATHRYRSNYTIQKWLEMIRYEIDNNGPVLYGGTGNDGGHQFVCDGYDADNAMVHINWGWSGSDDGYFSLTLSIPGSYTFDEGQSAIFGLVPDRSGTSEYGDCEITMINYDFDGYEDAVNGLEIISGTVAKGETFQLIAGKIYNGSSQNYLGAIKVVLVDKNGNWKEDISEPMEMKDGDDDETGLGAGYVFWLEDDEAFSCTISKDIALGDRIALWYRLNDGSWTPVIIDHEDLTVPWEWACVDACFIKVPDTFSSGAPFYYEIIPGNKGISSIAWSFDGTTVSDLVSLLSSGTHIVKAVITFTDNTKETVTRKIVVR